MKRHCSPRTLVLVLLTLALAFGCAKQTQTTPLPVQARPDFSCYELIPQEALTSLPRMHAAEGLKALDQGDLNTASEEFNKALKLDLNNSYLQYLNGLAYHLRAVAGEGRSFALAREGYKLAVKFDPTNWLAHAYLGLLALDERQYAAAQEHLAEAVIYNPEDKDLLYALATASYYAGDLVTADAALHRARELGGDQDPMVLRASAITSAALDRPEAARSFFDQYKAVEPSRDRQQYVANRIESWERTIGSGVIRAQYDDDPFGGGSYTYEGEDYEDESAYSSTMGEYEGESVSSDFVDTQMVMVDVIIIRTEEDISTSRGVNLLTGLKLQFGDADEGYPAWSWSKENTYDLDDPLNNVDARTVTRYISIPAVTYSLNIFNDTTGTNEILAQPTLIALSGQTSEFFSGTEVSAAAVSGGSGDSVSIEKEVGVKLAVTPEFLPGNLIRLNVTAERTFLTNPSTSVIFQFRLDTSKTQVNANVVMRLGETLILSGLSEKEIEKDRDGVPLLQDVPVVQYLFSNETARDFRKSVLILLTPRSTQYVNQSDKLREQTKAQLTEEQRAVKELEDRYSDWFQPHPAWAPIFQHMRKNSIYREFRTGDFTLTEWQTGGEHLERLKRAVEFLYY